MEPIPTSSFFRSDCYTLQQLSQEAMPQSPKEIVARLICFCVTAGVDEPSDNFRRISEMQEHLEVQQPRN